jgi:hypothetical protein
LDWLARSTVPRAQACREFLNSNLCELPIGLQVALRRDLRDRWQSAFFELIVARTVQLLGGTLDHEQAQPGRRRPDFVACFPDGCVMIESTSPVINAKMGDEAHSRQWMLGEIERHAPIGWHTSVLSLPEIPPTAPRKHKNSFRVEVNRLLTSALPTDQTEVRLSAGLPEGDLEIMLHRRVKDPAGSGLGMEPVLGVWDDTSDRVQRAVKRKRSQVRSAAHPALLAIQGSGIGSDLEDFDIALFGRTVDYRDVNGRHIGDGFDTSGAFFAGGEETPGNEPSIAGVLAFLDADFRRVPLPVLYLHPRFRGPLPRRLLDLTSRTFDVRTRSIVSSPRSGSDLLGGFGFVKV